MSAFGLGQFLLKVSSNASKKSTSLLIGTCITSAFESINAYVWIGYVGVGTRIESPGEVTAIAR